MEMCSPLRAPRPAALASVAGAAGHEVAAGGTTQVSAKPAGSAPTGIVNGDREGDPMRIAILTATLAAAPAAWAQDAYVAHPFEGTFEDAAFAVESAITNQGLVIDYVSHVGDMLNRTGQDVGSDVVIFDQAEIFVFCSAAVSRRVMEADPMNIAFCPYGIFVSDRGGEVTVGYRTYPEGPMDEVEAMLEGIVAEAVGS